MPLNSAALLPSLSMFFVGLVVLLLWRNKYKTKNKIILWGAAIWIVAVGIKTIIAILIDLYGGLYVALFPAESYGPFLYYLYVGLMTGIFEVFIPLYIILKKRGLLQLLRDTKSQLSFGVVFGCTEALIFGISGMVVFASVASLGVDAPASWTHLFSQPNEIYVLNAFYSGLERMLAIIVHVFSMMLIFFFIIRKKIMYLASVVVYKTFIDGITAFFLLSPIIFTLEFVEGFFVLIGIISFIILRSMLGKPMAKKRVKKTKIKESKRRKR